MRPTITEQCLKSRGSLNEAIEAYDKALSIRPDFAGENNLGLALQDCGNLDEAIEAFTKTLSLSPDFVEAHHNLGNALSEIGKLDEAKDALLKTVSLKPDYAEAHYNLGNIYKKQGIIPDAIASYEKALSLNPKYSLARVQKLHQQAHICDWSAMEADKQYLEDLGIKGGSVTPFAMLAIEDAPHSTDNDLRYTQKKPILINRHMYVIGPPRNLSVSELVTSVLTFTIMRPCI